MVMRRVTATSFKAHCLALLDEAAAGEEIIVTKHGRPVARVGPAVSAEPLRGSVTYLVADEGLIDPLDEEWDAEQ